MFFARSTYRKLLEIINSCIPKMSCGSCDLCGEMGYSDIIHVWDKNIGCAARNAKFVCKDCFYLIYYGGYFERGNTNVITEGTWDYLVTYYVEGDIKEPEED